MTARPSTNQAALIEQLEERRAELTADHETAQIEAKMRERVTLARIDEIERNIRALQGHDSGNGAEPVRRRTVIGKTEKAVLALIDERPSNVASAETIINALAALHKPASIKGALKSLTEKRILRFHDDGYSRLPPLEESADV